MPPHLPLVLAILALALSPAAEAAQFDVAWLAPRDEYLDMRAGSSLGGLALGINTIEDTTSHTFTVYHEDDKCNVKDSVIAIYQILINQTIQPDVIIGPPCSESMGRIGELAGFRDVPIIGYLSDSPSFKNKGTYNSLVRVLPPINTIVDGLMEMLEVLEWYTIEVINSVGSPYSDMGSAAYNLISNQAEDAENPVTLVRWVQDIELGASEEEITTVYQVLKKEARIVILCIPRDELRTWMLVASQQGMTSGDYVFFYLNVEMQNNEITWEAGDDDDDDAEQAFSNLLVLTMQYQSPSDLTTYNQLADNAAESNQWKDKFSGVTPKSSDIFSPFLHDAVLLYSKLADEAITAGAGANNGSWILDASRGRHFSGAEWATGEVYMDSNGDREPDFWLSDMGDDGVFTHVMKTIHKTTNGVHSRTVKELDDIIWGDGSEGTANKPLEIPDCGFEGEKCEDKTAVIVAPVVIVVLIIAGIVGYLIYRRWSFEQSIKKMLWKINYEDLKWPDKAKGTASNMFMKASRTSCAKSQHSQADAASHKSAGDGGQVFIDTAGLKGSTVAVKKVRKNRMKVDRILMVEMTNMIGLKNDKVASFVGAAIEPPNICEVWEYCSKGSLQDVIWNENITLDDMFKFSITIDILKGLKYLHDSPFKMHGRLKSSNCVVDARWTCKLMDYGLLAFREGAEPDQGISAYKQFYEQFWTAPELLRAGTSGGMAAMSQEGDVFSCAIIIKEIFCGNGPYTEYADMEAPDIIKAVERLPASHGSAFRPELSEMEGVEKMVGLIKHCWDERPPERPTVSQALKEAQSINPFKSANVMDNMINMMERYTNNLEEIVDEKTVQVAEEKKKSEELLYRMLPKAVGEELKKGKMVAPEEFESVTLYFSDIVSFTALAAQSTPLQVVAMLNGLNTLFDSTIARHDVFKVETIGDAYMLCSGLPKRNGDNHAADITNCAMDLLSVVTGFKVAHMKNYQLKIRIGLHTGPCVAGVVGLTMPRYCLFGDAVSQATLMESGGKPMRIHLSQNTYQILSKFSGYHLAERVEADAKTGVQQTSYFVVKKDGYKRPFPDYDELAAEDDPPTRKLPVCVGKEFRSNVA